MGITIKCNICENESTFLERYEGAPHSLMNQFDSKQIKVYDINLYRCSYCGHMQIPHYITEGYYNEYTMGSFWGESFIKLRESQIERLVKLSSKNNRFLDIGCGAGHYLAIAQKYYKDLWGVEPSTSSSIAARKRGFNIVNDYFHDKLSFESGFDAISMIEVLEHLEKPVSTLKHASSLINEDGVLIVEVPNGQRIFENKLYRNLCTDHIQYFSTLSLTEMARRAGLTVICVQEAQNPNILELYTKKTVLPAESFSSSRKYAVDRLLSKVSENDKIAAWGAGAEAICFISMLNGKVEINCLFDSDQSKYGHQIANIPIIQPTAESVMDYDKIIIFANAHKHQIENQLFQLGFKGSLLVFDDM